MKCDRCEQEATVHELRVVAGKKVEKHLCETCAREDGIQTHGSGSVGELVGQLMLASAGPASPLAGVTKPAACPTCKTTFADFRQTGLMGCADCYAAFERALTGLLERAHEGGMQHIGKSPKHHKVTATRAAATPQEAAPHASPASQSPAATSKRSKPESAGAGAASPATAGAKHPDPAEVIAQWRRQLEQALKHEQYEKAAKIRDELRRLTGEAGGSASKPSKSTKAPGAGGAGEADRA